MMELNLSRVDFCQVATTSQKCMHLLPAAGRKDPLQKVGEQGCLFIKLFHLLQASWRAVVVI